MLKPIPLLIVCSLLSIMSYGQNNDLIKGKWKIITIDAVFYHDYRNDSTFYPPAMLESLKGNKDSAFMIGFFDGMINGFKQYYYDFKENNEYQEIKNDKIKEQGTYEVNSNNKTVILQTKDKFGRETKQTLLYELVNNILSLTIPSEEIDLKIQLIR